MTWRVGDHKQMWALILLAAGIVIVGVGATAYWSYRQTIGEARAAMVAVASRAQPPSGTFDPAMVATLPEVARRYFSHAIQPGSTLFTTVRLEMEGVFLLGDRERNQTFEMTARQVLAPPHEFVWMPSMHSGIMNISGSDALVHHDVWTRFWINGLLPVVNEQDTPDLKRSALTRAAMEAIWSPASLLPINGTSWEQTGPDTARVRFSTGIEPMDITLGPQGEILEVVAMRWSDQNPQNTFQLQPFGGTMGAEKRFQGFTIPSRVSIGNHFTTDDYMPFFQVEITQAEYF